MRRRRIKVVVGVLILVAVVVAAGNISRLLPNSSPDPTSGFHIIDGYTLGPESPCSAATHVDPSASLVGHYQYGSPDFCDGAVPAATEVLLAESPGAAIVRAAVAPPSCGDPYTICTFGELGTPLFVVFDLANGSRRAIGLQCLGPQETQGSALGPASCSPNDFHGTEFYEGTPPPSS
jgi:hypothetical protein